MKLNKNKLHELDSRYRGIFINALAGIKQAFLIGTKSKDGHSNLAIFNSLVHVGANPPFWGFICRPDTVKRDTLSNILETGFYTINYIPAQYFQKAHQTSAKYERDVSEFEACGFSEQYEDPFFAPFVGEAVVKVGMKFQEKIDIPLNGTALIIGSLELIEINDSLVSEDGFVAIHKANILACAGLDAYYETTLLGRLSYARPFQLSEKI